MTKTTASLLFSTLIFTSSAFAADKARLTEPEIAEVLITINKGEVAAAELAEDKAQHKDVKNFAQMMLKEHKNNQEMTKELAEINKVEPKESAISKALKSEVEKTNDQIDDKEKLEFDRAYISQQVKMHETALTTIKDTLIPSAVTPALKAHLEKTQVSVAAHLEHAKQLQTKLK